MKRAAYNCLLLCLLFASCSQEKKFSKELWKDRDQRKYIINDLMKNHLNKELTYDEVADLLGIEWYEWDSTKQTYLGYQIELEFCLNIDPYKSTALMIYFDKDSITERVEFIE